MASLRECDMNGVRNEEIFYDARIFQIKFYAA